MKKLKLSFRSITIIASIALLIGFPVAISFPAFILLLFFAFSIDKRSLSYELNFAYAKNPSSLKPHFTLLKNDLFLAVIGAVIGSISFFVLQFLVFNFYPRHLISVYSHPAIIIFAIIILISIFFIITIAAAFAAYPDISPEFKASKNLQVIKTICSLILILAILPFFLSIGPNNQLLSGSYNIYILFSILSSFFRLPIDHLIPIFIPLITVTILFFLAKILTKFLPHPLPQLFKVKSVNKRIYHLAPFLLLFLAVNSIANSILYPSFINKLYLLPTDKNTMASLLYPYISYLFSLLLVFFVFAISTINHYHQLLPSLPSSPKKVRQSIFMSNILYAFTFSPFVIFIFLSSDPTITKVVDIIQNKITRPSYSITSRSNLPIPFNRVAEVGSDIDFSIPVISLAVQLFALILLPPLFSFIGLLSTKSKYITSATSMSASPSFHTPSSSPISSLDLSQTTQSPPFGTSPPTFQQ